MKTDKMSLFLSLGGVGFIPIAPGTWGSLAALPLLYLLGSYNVPVIFILPALILSIIVTSFAIEAFQKKMDLADPGWIVLDEFIGMIVTWSFVPTARPLGLLVIFIFFRIFDIFKFWPVSTIDKKIKHGAGVVLDDVMAGIYAGICSLIIDRYLLQVA